MTTNSNEKTVSKTLRLCRVRDISKTPGYEPFTPSVVRHLIFDAEPRVGSGGTIIPGNGLASAIVRIGRKVLIDLDRFDAWISPTNDDEMNWTNLDTQKVTVGKEHGHPVNVHFGSSMPLAVPPGCNKLGKEIAFAGGHADAPTEITKSHFKTGLVLLNTANVMVAFWPKGSGPHNEYAVNCARMLTGIGTPPKNAIQVTEQIALCAGDTETPVQAALVGVGKLGVLSTAAVKALSGHLFGADGLEIGQEIAGWVKTNAPKKTVDAASVPKPSFVVADDVPVQSVEWLWEGRIPKGCITLFDGHPGQGKSTLAYDIAACVSVGKSLSDGAEVEPRDVVIVNCEDSPAFVQNPRILAAGGNLKRIHICPNPNADYTGFYLPDDIDVLKNKAAELNIGLMIFDPLAAHINPKFKVENDQHMKHVLQAVNKLAQDLNVPILAVRHLRKLQTGVALISGMGSMGIIGSARVAFLVGPDPDSPEDKIFACSMMKVAPMPTSLGFRMVSVDINLSDGKTIPTTKIKWLGESPYTADDLCKPEKAALSPAVAEAVEFLKELLADGGLLPKLVFDEAEEAGISEATVKRAKKPAGVKSTKTASGWLWELPKPKE